MHLCLWRREGCREVTRWGVDATDNDSNGDDDDDDEDGLEEEEVDKNHRDGESMLWIAIFITMML